MVLKVDPPAERVLGIVEGTRPGPLFFALGGIHGNEPGGVVAARRVLRTLEEHRVPLAGRLVALACNLGGLERGVRFVDEDMNRLWSVERLRALRNQPEDADNAEERELRSLLATVRTHLEAGPWERVVVLDMHSTSAGGPPFSIMADTIQNRRVAFALPVPVLLGLEETLHGTLLSYVGGRGHVAVCLEGGQNGLESTAEHHEAALWLTLVASGVLAPADAPVDLAACHAKLERTARGLPSVVEVAYREAIAPGDRFEMLPGFANFARVRRGQELARSGAAGDRTVRAGSDGLLLMPRYQGQGDDGFFLGHEVRPFWLKLSALLRRARLYRLLPWLPGVRRDPDDPQALRADTHVARWLPRQVFHLFGYRHARDEDAVLVFVRRPDTFR